MVVLLSKHPDVTKFDISSVKTIVCAAAPLAKETSELLAKRLGIMDIRQGIRYMYEL